MGYPPLIEPETYQPPVHKRALINCPQGCDYFDCAINDEVFDQCAVYTDGKLDCIATYKRYYKTKTFPMRWNRKPTSPF